MARIGRILVLVFGTATLAVIAYWMLFTTFMSHDDEGYVLISLRNYCTYGGLYAKVYSQYGPFLYFIHDLGHRLLHYEFTNTNGRLITLIFWAGAAVACAHLVWRHTRSVALSLFTAGLTFFHLWLMVSEPIHPGGLIAFLVALGAWWGASQIEKGAMRSLAITAGVIGAAMLLTKINVGIFYFAAAGAWFAIQLRDFNQAKITGAIATALLILLPFALMRSEFGEPWVRTFATASAVASAAMMMVTWIERRPLTAWNHAGWGATAAFLFGTVVILIVCLRGTTITEMINGVLLEPLRQPSVYHYPPDWKPGTRIVCGISLLLAICAWKYRGPLLNWILVVIRLLLITEFSLASVEALRFTGHSSTMSYMVPFAWIFVLRLAPDEKGDRPNVASWIGLLLVLQYLHAYPVAGSQIAWGTFLIVPVMALGLDDTRRFLDQQKRLLASVSISLVFPAIAIFATARLGEIGWHRYKESRPLGLPGAENIRVPEEFASTLRILSLNAAAHGDMLFSLPGMFSFNGWTDLPTPTLNNTTHWFSLLKQKQQDEIAAAIGRSHRPVLIIHRGLLEFLTDSNFVVRSTLNDYLKQTFTPVFKLGKYEFLVHKGRQVVPLDTAELLQLSHPQPGMAPNRLEIIVAVPAGSKVARIELATLADKSSVLKHWDKSTNDLTATPINLQGIALAAETNPAWRTPLPPLVRLDLSLKAPLSFVRRYTVVYLRDEEGAVVAEARFTE